MRQYLRTFSARNASPDVQSYKVQVHVCQILIPLYTRLQKVVCFTPKNHPNTNSWERIKLQNPRLKSSSFPSGQTTSSWEEPEEEKEDEVESRTFHGFPQVPLCHIVTSPRPLRLSHTYTHLWMSGDSLTVVSYWSTRGRGGVWLEWNSEERRKRESGTLNRFPLSTSQSLFPRFNLFVLSVWIQAQKDGVSELNTCDFTITLLPNVAQDEGLFPTGTPWHRNCLCELKGNKMKEWDQIRSSREVDLHQSAPLLFFSFLLPQPHDHRGWRQSHSSDWFSV